jgi:hypothetical protein
MVNNNPTTESVKDLGIRRTRILMHGQITPRILVFWIIGANNQTFNSGGLQGGDIGTGTSGVDGKRPQVYVHDSWGEFRVTKGPQLHVGGGLLTWSGLSRMTNAATLNFLMVDAPIYNWTTDRRVRPVRAHDRALRQGHRRSSASTTGGAHEAVLLPSGQQQTTNVTVALPASAGGGTITVPGGRQRRHLGAHRPRRRASTSPTGTPTTTRLMPQLYANWDFFDVESAVLPFMVGSYTGRGKVFNIGAGFQYHPHAMRYVRRARRCHGGGHDAPRCSPPRRRTPRRSARTRSPPARPSTRPSTATG